VWKIVTVALWCSSLVVALGFSLALGLNLVLAPAAIVVGMSVGTAARRLSTWTCPRCGSELVEPETSAARIPAPAVRVTPAHAPA
jgi:hypothetical protein